MVRHTKMWELCQTAGPIGTKFGTRMHIHLGMIPDGHGGGVRGVINSYIWESFQTTGTIGTKFDTRLQIHLGIDIG